MKKLIASVALLTTFAMYGMQFDDDTMRKHDDTMRKHIVILQQSFPTLTGLWLNALKFSPDRYI